MNQEVRLLGGMQVTDGQRSHRPALTKSAALLAYLASHGDWVDRERLAFLFWPDLPGSRSRTNLRGLLARCRKLPLTDRLDAENDRVRWRVACDVPAFRAAVDQEDWAAAIACYGGPLLGGAALEASPEFATWLEMEREGLKEAHRTAVFRRAEDLRAAGRTSEAAGLVADLVQVDPLDEEAVRAAMRLAADSGDADRALRTYRGFRRRLEQELELAPTSATERLAEEMEAQAVQGSLAAPAVGGPPQPSSRATPSPIPVAATSFVGRELELAELRRLLEKPGCRLVTVTGPAGAGKTRLALRAAEGIVDDPGAGVAFVPLDALTAARAVPAAIAAALGIRLHEERDALEQVAAAIGDLELLLVLDNFEQLLDARTVPAALLRACPDLRVLVTSRERLGLAEEWLFPLEGLTFPRDDVAPEEARAFDAVRFFLERAQHVRPGFGADDAVLPDVIRVCRLVEGLPLGLELAAVWVRVLPPGDIAQEIAQNIDFLADGVADLPERHRSARAAIQHSWELLSPGERAAARKTSVFRGGFARDAAAYVAGASIAVLAALVDKSLLRLQPGGRYLHHPLLLQFTAEKLAEHPDEAEEARSRHAVYYTNLAETAGTRFHDTGRAEWPARLDLEHENLRGAHRWTVERADEEIASRLAEAMYWYWGLRGLVGEGRAWLTEVLAIPSQEDSPFRLRLLTVLAGKLVEGADVDAAQGFAGEALAMARRRGDVLHECSALDVLGRVTALRGNLDEGRALTREALRLARRSGDRMAIQVALNNLGYQARAGGDHDEAGPLLEESLAVARAAGDRKHLGIHLVNLGRLRYDQGDRATARAHLEQAVALFRELESPQVARALHHLGILARSEGDLDAASAFHAEALVTFWEGGWNLRVVDALEAIAALCAGAGAVGPAARIWGATEAYREARGARRHPDEQDAWEREVRAARDGADEGRFRADRAAGRALTLGQAVDEAVTALAALDAAPAQEERRVRAEA